MRSRFGNAIMLLGIMAWSPFVATGYAQDTSSVSKYNEFGMINERYAKRTAVDSILVQLAREGRSIDSLHIHRVWRAKSLAIDRCDYWIVVFLCKEKERRSYGKVFVDACTGIIATYSLGLLPIHPISEHEYNFYYDVDSIKSAFIRARKGKAPPKSFQLATVTPYTFGRGVMQWSSWSWPIWWVMDTNKVKYFISPNGKIHTVWERQ